VYWERDINLSPAASLPSANGQSFAGAQRRKVPDGIDVIEIGSI
jgi:hypothetical protein